MKRTFKAWKKGKVLPVGIRLHEGLGLLIVVVLAPASPASQAQHRNPARDNRLAVVVKQDESESGNQADYHQQ